MSWQNVVQTKRFETTEPSILGLWRLESNGTATVGTSYDTLINVGVGGSYTHNAYCRFGNCFSGTPDGPGNGAGYSYRKVVSSGNWATELAWTTSRSYRVWFKVVQQGTSAAHYLFGFSDGGSGLFSMGLTNNQWSQFNVPIVGSGLIVQLYSNTSLVDLADGNVHCAEYVCAAADDHRLYIDGILHDSSSTSATSLIGNEANLGATAYGNGTGPWGGLEDEVSVVSYARTAKQCYANGGALVC